MSLPVMVDVAIGLAGLFLALSLIASFLLEIYVGLFNRHGQLLRKAIGQLLDDTDGKGLAAELYDHPLIRGLKSGFRLPSAIPSPIFARAIVDLMDRSGALQTGMVAEVLRPAFLVAQGNKDKLITELETWFDRGLERMSGSIARRSQMWLIPIAVILTLGLNINTLKVYEALSTQEPLREAAAKTAEATANRASAIFETEAPASGGAAPTDNSGKEGTSAAEQQAADKRAAVEEEIAAFRDLFGGLPMGWPCASADAVLGKLAQAEGSRNAAPKGQSLISCIGKGIGSAGYPDWIGWFVTIIAISFGAQFWYRILKSLIKIRSLSPSKPKAKPTA